jgi:hypothetical protein
MNRWSVNSYVVAITEAEPTATLVCVPENRLAKFQRNFPAARPYKDALQGAYDVWKASLTEDVKKALAMSDHGSPETLRQLDASKIDDPAVREAIRIAKVDVSAALNARRRFRNILHTIDTTEATEDALEPYPLLNALGTYSIRHNLDHLYLYMNAVFADAS